MSTIHSTLTVPDFQPEDVGTVRIDRAHSTASAFVLPDGRVDVQLTEKAFRLTKHLQTRSFKSLHLPLGEDLTKNNKHYDSKFQAILGKYSGIPRLNIAIHIVGSRGDVQPFVAIGQILQKPPYGHRIRICTHPVFKDFVEENGLEFFSIGGDPAVLMAYMVKNPGLMPGKESWKAGDVGKRRADIAQILEGCWRSCIEPGDGMGGERKVEGKTTTEDADRLFIADAIIANPPSYGHIHCAEKLGIPLHMMFTMPWSPTQYFPHPLASLERNDSDPNLANYISYTLMELLAWQGLGDVINGFRMKTLHLDAISPLWGHMLLSRMKVPFTYAWSSALIPKPPDWGSYINISGFAFLSAPSTYKPPDDLMAFLNAGPPPVYIGFGSIVVDDPNALTSMIFGAVKRAGVRALVSKGWGGIGGEEPPEGVFLLGNCPHDWLFKYVSAVVHHGGAGTTAIGIAMGKPTVVVPFFGDQPFWGAMIYRAGAGPEPVPYKKMTEEILAESITKALGPEIQTAVKEMSEKIANENGATDAAASFSQAINMDSMRCLLSPENVAVWRVKKTNIRLCGLAAATLIDNGFLALADLKLIRHRDWYIDEGASNPVFGAVAAVSSTLTNTIVSVNKYGHDMHHTIHKKPGETTLEISTPEEHGPPEPFSEEMGKISSRFPIQNAARYPPQHLEMVAYQMASKTLPNTRNSAKHRRTYSWSPVQRAATLKSVNSNASKEAKLEHEHGRLHDVGAETGHLTVSLLGTGLRAPVAFFYQLANGFHNAPSFIFHDDTVRRRDNITGIGSGIKGAFKGLTLNLYDGFTGLAYHPYQGAKTEGVAGFGKGVGKGVGGLVFKTTAAVLGVPAYTMKGMEKQFEKRFDRQLKARILSVRMRQGLAAYGKASEQEKELIMQRWREYGCTKRIPSKDWAPTGVKTTA